MVEAGIGKRELPVSGEVSELRVVGNGKDSVLQVRVPDGRAFAVPLSGGRTKVICCDGVVIATKAHGDTEIEVCYRPIAGRNLRIVRVEVDYPGSEQDWASDCEIWERMSRARWPRESSWAVSGVVVELATSIDAGDRSEAVPRQPAFARAATARDAPDRVRRTAPTRYRLRDAGGARPESGYRSDRLSELQQVEVCLGLGEELSEVARTVGGCAQVVLALSPLGLCAPGRRQPCGFRASEAHRESKVDDCRLSLHRLERIDDDLRPSLRIDIRPLIPRDRHVYDATARVVFLQDIGRGFRARTAGPLFDQTRLQLLISGIASATVGNVLRSDGHCYLQSSLACAVNQPAARRKSPASGFAIISDL